VKRAVYIDFLCEKGIFTGGSKADRQKSKAPINAFKRLEKHRRDGMNYARQWTFSRDESIPVACTVELILGTG
jgi:hypothetical protein